MDASKPVLRQLKGRFQKLQIVVSLKDFFSLRMGSFLSLCLLFLPSPYCPVFSQVILHTPLKLLLNRSLPCLLSLLCSYLNKQKGGSSSPHWRNHWFSNSAFLGCTIFQQGCWSGVESKIYFFYFLNSFEKKKKKNVAGAPGQI